MSMRPGDWTCSSCHTVNFASRNECRNMCSGVTRPSNAGPPPARAGDWQCQCGASNFASRTMCFTCQRPRASPGGTKSVPTTSPPPASTVKAGDWQCPCGTNNFASRGVCFKCQRAKGAPTGNVLNPYTAVRAGDWNCECGANNYRRALCHKCQKPKPVVGGGVSEPSTTVMSGDWQCASCHANNFAFRQECYACKLAKGVRSDQNSQPNSMVKKVPSSGQQQQQQQQPAMKAGDWSCAQCSFSNFGSRTACFSCGAARPSTTSTTTTAGAGSPALDAADATILGIFALPTYWTSDAKAPKPALQETGYFGAVAATLWSKFATATRGRKIQQVMRVENVALWHGYCAEVQRLVAKYPNQAAPVRSKWQPQTLQILPDQYHINETYLLHGTSPDVAKLIVEGGFDPSHSGESAGALFGQGTYFSDSLDKVMKYSKGCVVVSRVALGEVAVPPHPGSTSSYRRPPAKNNSSEEYDSLVATASHTPTLKEFIVYRHTKAYPEYLIFHD